MEGSCAKKMAVLTILAILILFATALSTQVPEVKAAVGDNHRIDAGYYRALISNRHDQSSDGEWHFKITSPAGTYYETDEIQVGNDAYADFDLSVDWLVGADTTFECSAWEMDTDGLDYESSITVSIALPGTNLNDWVTDSTRKGDVTHYYRYRMENRLPVLDSLTGPSNGYYDVDHVFSASASDADGDSVTYEWKVDGTTQPSTSSTLTYRFTDEASGDHTISVRAKDALENLALGKKLPLIFARARSLQLQPLVLRWHIFFSSTCSAQLRYLRRNNKIHNRRHQPYSIIDPVR